MKTLDEIEGAILNDAKVKKSNNDQKQNDKEKKTLKKMLTKVVIRRLPPLMTEEEFIKQTDPLPDHDYLYFVPADWSLGQHASSRAYINFVRHEDIFLFKDKFDGYVFVDNKGVEHPAVVEFAPFQGLPKNKSRKKDKKCNTIDKDQHFVNFLASLANEENEINKPEMKMEYSFQLKDDKKITSTPLLEFLANRKQESREERRRKSMDKKKQREDEKNQKKDQQQQSRSDDNNSSRGGRDGRRKRDAMKSKNKVSYPPPIPEEDNNDGIIVRTVKSRLGNNNNNDRKRDRVFESKQNKPNQPLNKTNNNSDTPSKSIAKDDHNDRDRDRERKPSMDNNEQRRAANALRESNRRKERKLRKMERENNRKDGGSGGADNFSSGGGRGGGGSSNNGGGGTGGGGSSNQNNKESTKITNEKTAESNKQDMAPQTSSKSVESNQPQTPREEKVRKYSESRRDRRSSRTENKSSTESNQIKIKDDLPKQVSKPQMSQPSIKQTEENNSSKSVEQLLDDTDIRSQRRQSIDSKNDSGSGGDNSRDNSKAKQEEREHLGRIRNKDRPSLQIYQPGKRRPTGSSKDDKTNPNSPTERMAKTPEFETNLEIIENILSKIELPKEEKSEKIVVVKVDKQLPPVPAIVPSSAVVVAVLPPPTAPPTLPPSTEKRVSRYSERRNRNKERLSKRDEIQKSDQTDAAGCSVPDIDDSENITKEIEESSEQLNDNE